MYRIKKHRTGTENRTLIENQTLTENRTHIENQAQVINQVVSQVEEAVKEEEEKMLPQ